MAEALKVRSTKMANKRSLSSDLEVRTKNRRSEVKTTAAPKAERREAVTLSTVSANTNGVVVRVDPTYYRSDVSDPAGGLFVWTYRVTVENQRPDTIQITERHWSITDGEGQNQQVHGDGVVGHLPCIFPGKAFSYVSGVPLFTPNGKMRGDLWIRCSDKEEFGASIPEFELHAPRDVAPPPAVDPDHYFRAVRFSEQEQRSLFESLRRYAEEADRPSGAYFSVSKLTNFTPSSKLAFIRILLACRVYGESGVSFFNEAKKSRLNLRDVFGNMVLRTIIADDIYIHATSLEGRLDVSVIKLPRLDDLLEEALAIEFSDPALRRSVLIQVLGVIQAARETTVRNTVSPSKSKRRISPERTIRNLLNRYNSAVTEFARLQAGSQERLTTSYTIISCYENLEKRGYPVDDLDGLETLTEARRVKHADWRQRKKAQTKNLNLG